MIAKNLSKKISGESGFSINLFDGISFEIPEGKITSIIAPKKSGKTTLLKIVSGIEKETGGEVILSPHKKAVFIPSASSSLPWFNVKENLSLVSEKQELIEEIIKLTGLEGYEHHRPDNESIGFRFLITIGMALLSGADLIVADAEFTSFSEGIKEKIIRVLRRIAVKKNISFLFAFSEAEDALLLSDRVLVMNSVPLKIRGELEIDPRHERKTAFLKSPQFDDYMKKIASF